MSDSAPKPLKLGPPGVAALVLFALATLPFLSALSGGFVFDDAVAITNNQAVISDFSLANIFGSGFWGGGLVDNSGSYRPITVLSFALDHRLGDGDPWVFHLTNILLHGLCVLTILWVLGRRFGRGVAAAVAALFAVHALHTENVASLVGRADVIATIFGLIAWKLYHHERPAVAAFSGVVLLLSMLSKEVGIAFFGVVLAEEVLKLGPSTNRPAKARWFALAAMACAVALYLTLRLEAIGTISARVLEQSNPLIAEVGAFTQTLTASTLLSKALGLFAFPATLCADYSYAQILPVTSVATPGAALGLLLWLGLPVAALLLRRKCKGATIGIVLFFAAYVPISNLILVVPTIFGERLLYLPSLGLCLAAVSLLAPQWQIQRHRVLVGALLVCAIAGQTVRTVARSRDWRSSRALFTAATRAAPNSARSWFNLGVAALSEGKPTEALAHLNRSLSIYPKHPLGHSYAGVALDQLERPKEAHGAMFRAVRMRSWCRECVMNLVNLYIKYGFFADARNEIAGYRAAGGDLGVADSLAAKVDGVEERSRHGDIAPKRRGPN